MRACEGKPPPAINFSANRMASSVTSRTAVSASAASRPAAEPSSPAAASSRTNCEANSSKFPRLAHQSRVTCWCAARTRSRLRILATWRAAQLHMGGTCESSFGRGLSPLKSRGRRHSRALLPSFGPRANCPSPNDLPEFDGKVPGIGASSICQEVWDHPSQLSELSSQFSPPFTTSARPPIEHTGLTRQFRLTEGPAYDDE